MLTAPRPLRVGILCSRRAPGLLHLLTHDRRRGSAYDIVCCVASDEAFADQARVEEDHDIPCILHPIATFCRERDTTWTDMSARGDYDAATVEILSGYEPDLLVLVGYLLLVTPTMLRAYDRRILNIHHGDLFQRGPDGQVRYPGLRAVRDAFMAGERETRATAHVVNERLDDGPVVLRSWSFRVPQVAAWARAHEQWDVLRAAAWAHQEWMLRDAWGPMLAASIELAGLAMESPGSPMAVSRIGAWTLSRDGSLTPNAMLEIA